MIRLLVILLCLGAPAAATQDRWPALFDVAGVAADDVLNVRAAADAASPVVGFLPPDARDVEIIAPDPRGRWGRVNLGETTGWVSLRFVRRQAGQWLGAIPEVRQCRGTEPFWALSRNAGGVRFETPEGSAGGRLDAASASANRRDRSALSMRFEPGNALGLRDGVALLSLGQCNDGMSDRAFGISLDLLARGADGARLLSGCCSLQP